MKTFKVTLATGKVNVNQPFDSIVHRLLPEGRSVSGRFEIKHVTVSQQDADFSKLRAAINSHRTDMSLEPGTYAQLIEHFPNGGSCLWMANTPMERRTNQEFQDAAHGDVLIFGLGIGMIIPDLLSNKRVRSITIVELEQEIIDFVGQHFQHPRITIIQGDARSYTGTRSFDTVYYDIWPELCVDNLDEMAQFRLSAAETGLLKSGGWVGCWSETELCIAEGMYDWGGDLDDDEDLDDEEDEW